MRILSLFVISAVACGGPPPAGVAKAGPDPLEADLVVFRSMHGKPWDAAQELAIAACARIFARVQLVGRASAEVTALLGPPDSEESTAHWRYTRHDGDAGCMHVVWLRAGVVVHVQQVPTQ